MDRRTFTIFKEQLFEFIEYRDEPFDENFIIDSCTTFIDRTTVRDALFALEEEGRIVRLLNGKYISARMLLKKWIKRLYGEIEVPEDIYGEMLKLIQLGIYKSIVDIIKDAIRFYIKRKHC